MKLNKQNQNLVQKMLLTSTKNKKSHVAPANSSDVLIQELIQDTNIQTQALQANQTSKSQPTVIKAPKNSTFPFFTATTLETYRIWRNKIIAIIATPEWSDLYDPKTKYIINSGLSFPKNQFTFLFFPDFSYAMFERSNNEQQDSFVPRRHKITSYLGYNLQKQTFTTLKDRSNKRTL